MLRPQHPLPIREEAVREAVSQLQPICPLAGDTAQNTPPTPCRMHQHCDVYMHMSLAEILYPSHTPHAPMHTQTNPVEHRRQTSKNTKNNKKIEKTRKIQKIFKNMKIYQVVKKNKKIHEKWSRGAPGAARSGPPRSRLGPA